MVKNFLILLFIMSSLAQICFASYEDRLFELENLRYGRAFANESLAERLLRLEEDYFGLSQSGDINSRINMLFQIAQNNYPNPMNLDRRVQIKKQSRIRNALRNFASIFTDGGVVTGFVPPISTFDNNYNYSSYNSAFENDYYNRFFTPPKYSPNYIPAHSYGGHYVHQPIINDYNSGYSTSNVQYDRYGYPSISNRDLYSRSAVRILRD